MIQNNGNVKHLLNLEENSFNNLDKALSQTKKLFDNIKLGTHEKTLDINGIISSDINGIISSEKDSILKSNGILKKKRDILVEPVIQIMDKSSPDIDSLYSESHNSNIALSQTNVDKSNESHLNNNDTTVLKMDQRNNSMKNKMGEKFIPTTLDNEDSLKNDFKTNDCTLDIECIPTTESYSNLKSTTKGFKWPLSTIRSIFFFISLSLPIILSFTFIYVLPCPSTIQCSNCSGNFSNLLSNKLNTTNKYQVYQYSKTFPITFNQNETVKLIPKPKRVITSNRNSNNVDKEFNSNLNVETIFLNTTPFLPTNKLL
ncbi:unnamed protein product [Gordionus sp. m RMFG-2023]